VHISLILHILNLFTDNFKSNQGIFIVGLFSIVGMYQIDELDKLIQSENFKNKVTYIQRSIIEWYKKKGRRFPWRSESSWKIGLITELLLQRTRATKVKEIYELFFNKYSDLRKLCKSPLDEIEALIFPLGLHRQRAKRLRKIACLIVEIEQVPSAKELKKLPGIGDYSANAVHTLYLGERNPLLDTNFKRVYSRYFNINIPSESKLIKLYTFAEEILPIKNSRLYNYGILDLAFLVCTFSKPKCTKCPLTKYCSYYASL